MSSKPPPLPDAAPCAFVFDRRRFARRRERIAPNFERYSFLKAAAAQDIALRLSAVNRRFERVLDLGAHDGALGRRLASDRSVADRIGEIIASDLSPAFAARNVGSRNFGRLSVAADEEALPFREGSFDLVVSALSLHWVNDLPGALIQIRRVLKPDGLFIGLLLGGRTLNELRASLLQAEEEARGGAAFRVSPVVDVVEGARLLQRAGFAMPVADGDVRTVRYGDPSGLLADLKGMGETASLAGPSPPPLTRSILNRALALYRQRYADPDGRVRASFEFVALSGWAPAPDQPKPKRPGSATTRLADALGVEEIATGVTADPTGRNET